MRLRILLKNGLKKWDWTGDGPYYVILSNFHLCHLEILKTARRILADRENVLLNNSKHPTISVATIAKKDIPRGKFIKDAIGCFEFRGEAVKICENLDHVPIGLMSNSRTSQNIQAGQQVTFYDIEVSDEVALNIWKKIIKTA